MNLRITPDATGSNHATLIARRGLQETMPPRPTATDSGFEPEEVSACAQRDLDTLGGTDLERVRHAELALAHAAQSGLSGPVDDVNAGHARAPRRIARWAIVVGIVLLAGSIAATVGPHAVSRSSPRPASGYLLTASDAHFTAMFPGKPLHIEKTAGTTTVIVYLADLPDHAVGIIRAPVPASGSFSLDRAVGVAASALPGGEVISRRSITYQGQPAEDAVVSVLGDPGQIRVVAFGSAAYIFEGFGSTAASFAHDYMVLLDSFRLLHP